MISIFFILLSFASFTLMMGAIFKIVANKKGRLEQQEIEELHQRNHELEMRVENLESVLTSIDPELLGGLLEMNHPKGRIPKGVRNKVKRIQEKKSRFR